MLTARIPARPIPRPRILSHLTPPPMAEVVLLLALLPVVLVVALGILVAWPICRGRLLRDEPTCPWCRNPTWACDCIDIGEPVGRGPV